MRVYDGAVPQVIQPFNMEIVPIQKLILFNFEKEPDDIYNGLELQYLVNNETAKGYRMIAYRKDGYVDLYDEAPIAFKENAKCDVCGKGLKHYCGQTVFENLCFELTEEGMKAGCTFQDYKGRKIEVHLQEHSKKKSRPFDLIAPIGVSSENPVVFPAFAMYQFDFVRKRNTKVSVKIEGKPMKLDVLPIPKDGQMRYFMRYGYDCELVEFAKAGKAPIEVCDIIGEEVHKDHLIAKYILNDGKYQMKLLKFKESRHTFQLIFEEAFPDLLRMKEGKVKGNFKIQMDESMGYFAGQYSVLKQGDIVDIMLEPTEGWQVENKMFLTKFMLNKKSVFREWPKTYRYLQRINLKTKTSTSKWIRLDKNIKRSLL